MKPAEASELPHRGRPDSVRRWAFIIGAGIFATNLSQPGVLSLPLRELLKEGLDLSAPEMAAFFALGAMPWYFKPLAGLVSDSVTLFGTHRRHYLIFSALLAGVMWLVLGVAPRTYFSLLLALTATNAMLVVASTVVGGLLVDAEKRLGAGGRLVAVRVFVDGVCLIIAGPLGGVLAGLPFTLAAAVGGMIAMTVVPVALMVLHEAPAGPRTGRALRDAYGQLKRVASSHVLWVAALFLFVSSLPQDISTVLYYHQRDQLKLSLEAIGWLKSLSGIGSLVAALVYGWVGRRFSLYALLVYGIAASAGGMLVCAFYDSFAAAVAIELVRGFLITFGGLVLMELAVWATPRGAAAMGFSLFMSAINGGAAISDVLAASIVAWWPVGLSGLAVIYALATLATLAALPFLPTALVTRGELRLTAFRR